MWHYREWLPQQRLVTVLLLLSYSFGAAQAGQLWPKPQSQTLSSHVLHIDPEHFTFRSKGYSSSILEAAYDRYSDLMFDTPDYEQSDSNTLSKKNKHRSIERLDVYVYSFDQSLNLDTDESYTLTVEAPVSVLQCHTVYGALRGLETLSQLIDRVPADSTTHPHLESASGMPKDTNNANQTPLQALKQMIQNCWGTFIQLLGTSHDDHSQSIVPQVVITHEADAAEARDHPVSDQDNFFDIVNDIPDHTDDSDSVLQWHKKHSKQHKSRQNKKHHKKHKKNRVQYTVNATAISDAPRFKHRGLLLDTSRHFLPVQNIKDHLDAMAWAKMNVFHWHIVDDQSFPFESHHLPGLSADGAFSARHVYDKQDVADIIAYAKDRGIRVIPEFDTPGHVASWGKGYPELLTQCYNGQGKPNGELGPLDPTRNSTYTALWLLFREAAQVFPDSYIHLGGDEVPFDCWQSNPDVQDWMQANSLGSLSQLEGYFESRVLDLATLAGRSYIVWQDVLDNNVTLRSDTVVHVWKWWPVTAAATNHTVSSLHAQQESTRLSTANLSQAASDQSNSRSSQQAGHQISQESSQRSHGPVGCQLSKGCPGDIGSYSAGEEPGWLAEMEKVTAQGFRALLSSPWYINLGGYAGDDWALYYAVEPLSFKGSRQQHDLVMGGEACMWGEFVDATNSMSATWPRAAAVAERLWSDQHVRDRHDAEERLHKHRCRMLARGLPAQPLGPGFCPQDFNF